MYRVEKIQFWEFISKKRHLWCVLETFQYWFAYFSPIEELKSRYLVESECCYSWKLRFVTQHTSMSGLLFPLVHFWCLLKHLTSFFAKESNRLKKKKQPTSLILFNADKFVYFIAYYRTIWASSNVYFQALNVNWLIIHE